MDESGRCGRATTRRRFLQQAATLAAATVSGGRLSAAAKDADAIPIIDTHQHLWDLSKFRLSWVRGNARLNRSFVTDDYLQATKGSNVVKAIYMEVAVDPDQQQEEAEYVIELCRSGQHPTVAAVISGQPASEDFAPYVQAYRDSPYVKGVRQVLHSSSTKPGLCLTESFVRSMRLLGDLGMRFDLCMRPAELQHGARLADLCPDTRFVLDHCGNPDPQDFRATGAGADEMRRRQQWRRDIGQMAQRKNMVCKISGIVARATPGTWTADDLAPIVNHCLDEFGPDRVMFASDWPVCTQTATLAQWVHALQQIVADRSYEHQMKLFHHNAQRFYQLSSAAKVSR